MADLSITPGNVKAGTSASVSRGISTGAINAGDVVCVLADGTLDVADANAGAPKSTPVGIAANTAAGAGQFVNYVALDNDFTIGATVASGNAYFLSQNPGKICDNAGLTAGSVAALIGFGKGTTKLVVQIVASGQTV